MNLEDLEKRIEKIEQRNKIVEENKSWETSKTRRILLLIFTYLSIGLYMSFVKIDRPWLNAIVPSLGFMLSTLSLPFIKKFWQKYMYKKGENNE